MNFKFPISEAIPFYKNWYEYTWILRYFGRKICNLIYKNTNDYILLENKTVSKYSIIHFILISIGYNCSLKDVKKRCQFPDLKEKVFSIESTNMYSISENGISTYFDCPICNKLGMKTSIDKDCRDTRIHDVFSCECDTQFQWVSKYHFRQIKCSMRV